MHYVQAKKHFGVDLLKKQRNELFKDTKALLKNINI